MLHPIINNAVKPITWLVMCVCLCSFASPILADDEQKKKFEEVKRSIEKLKAELEKTKSSRDDLHKSLETNEKNIRTLNNKSKELQENLEQSQDKLNELNREQTGLSKKKNEQVSLVENYVSAAYKLGQQSQIRLLLSQQHPAEAARMVKYYQAFSATRSEKISEFVATLERLNIVESEIADNTASLQRSYAELKEQQRALKNSQNQRQATLAKLNADVGNQQARLRTLEANRKRLETVLSKVYEEINAQELAIGISAFTQHKGQLPWPTKVKPRNRFGAKRSKQLRWQGLEFVGNRGDSVVAIHHGQVVFSDYLRGHGLLLIIDHGSGYMSLYAHNDNLYKELGEWVESGEAVASIGNTGGRTDTALYFELRHNGKPTNPTTWFKSA